MNPFDILKNAKAIQEQFSKVQEELAQVSVTGSSGGGIVKVTLNGKFEMIGVVLDPIAVDPRDVPMLQDLLVAAHADASERVKELIKDKLGPMAGGMPSL
ncbi:MAG TPA: YbaB/EbfC family nucleoid-associated protein [Treponemataceae bacterium]|nr:YbaB/EbfC family nucleoid-associated protein [Treponemataceae bacterium]